MFAAKALIALRRQIREEANALAGAAGAFCDSLARLGETLQRNAVDFDADALQQMAQALGAWQKTLHGEGFLGQAASWGEGDGAARLQHALQTAAEGVAQRLDGALVADAAKGPGGNHPQRNLIALEHIDQRRRQSGIAAHVGDGDDGLEADRVAGHLLGDEGPDPQLQPYLTDPHPYASTLARRPRWAVRG